MKGRRSTPAATMGRSAFAVYVVVHALGCGGDAPPISAVGETTPRGATTAPMQTGFSPPGGTFVGEQSVTLDAGQADASLYYTLDGSVPTMASEPYTGPIRLTESTEIRVLATSTATPGVVLSQTYVRLSDDVASRASNLPLAIIHTLGTGHIDTGSREFVPASLAVFDAKGGTATLLGTADLQTRIGIHVRGESSRDFPKKQYAVEFRAGPDDDDADLPLLGMPAESDWVFSAPIEFDRALMRNALAYEMSRAVGRQASRTKFAEVFLVDDGGALRSEHYVGVYVLMEKIKRGPDRVNVAKLDDTDVVEPAISGGYVFRDDKGGADFHAGGRELQFVYPDADDMQASERRPQRDYLTDAVDAFARAIDAGDFTDPQTGAHYSQLIDVDAWIDHNIVNALAKNVDALRISAYFHKERGGPIVAGPVWDFDRSLGTPYDGRATEPREWFDRASDATDYMSQGWWRRLFENEDFERRYWQRFAQVIDGPLSVSSLHAMIDRLDAEIGPSAERNFERWSERPPLDGSHDAEVQLLKDFLSERIDWIRTQIP